jgi:glycosyltransferase involved in cell wall biosynthesis
MICLLSGPRPDVVYASSPPLSVILPCVAALRLRRVPFVLEVREVWPEVPQGLDTIRSRGLIFLLRRLALLGYRRAARIVALTPAAAHHIQADIPLTPKVVHIAHCCDLDLFGAADGQAVRARHGWTDRFICLHVGPMVRTAGIEAILRVADAVREDEQFLFWLVGDGEWRAQIEQNIHSRELPNVVLEPGLPRAQLAEVIAAADLCLLTAGHYRVLEQAGAQRLFDYLAAGKPVLLNYSGWQREFLETHGAGLGANLGDYGEFFASICRLCDSPELRQRMGQAARRVAETVCHPDQWAGQLEQVLTLACATPDAKPKGGG